MPEPFRLSPHALHALALDGIPKDTVMSVLESPGQTVEDTVGVWFISL